MYARVIPVHIMGCTKSLTDFVRMVYIPAMHLSAYMSRNGLSDDEVAKAIGRSRVSVSRYRRGLVRPDWDAVESIKTFSRGEVSADAWLESPMAAE